MSGLTLSPLIGKSYSSIYGQTAPSNKVKVALIGCRSMGYGDLNTFLDYPETECVALCDVDDEWLNKRAADVEKKTGKKVPHLYKDWRRVIDNKERRCSHYRYAGPLALPSDGLGLPSGKRRICREAALQYDRGMQPDGKSRP